VDRDMPAEITLPMMRQSLYTAVVSDALDGLGLRNQSPRVNWGAVTIQGLLVGRCRTTLWADMYHDDPRPYALELTAVDGCRADDVMICAAAGSVRSALWGELLSTAAASGGAVGAIVDGLIRDVVKMRDMRFPVYARGTSPYDSLHRQRVVDLDVSVEIGGTRFQPGDLVLADSDGVVVVPREVETETVRAAWKKVHTENQVRDAIRDGMKATEAFDRFGVL
jgi:regulator of RNase E activity RraA